MEIIHEKDVEIKVYEERDEEREEKCDKEDSNTVSNRSSDIERMDEPWKERNDVYFNRMKNQILERANLHDKISKRNKKFYIYSSIPSIIIPIILTNFSLFLEDNTIIMGTGMSIVAVINGINALLNFSKKTETHNKYAGLYLELAGEIDKVLIRSKKFREPFDVILERVTMKKNNLDNNSPDV